MAPAIEDEMDKFESYHNPDGISPGGTQEADSQILALRCICKMAMVLDGDFAKQVVGSGVVPHLVDATFGGDRGLAREARDALVSICDKLPAGYMVEPRVALAL